MSIPTRIIRVDFRASTGTPSPNLNAVIHTGSAITGQSLLDNDGRETNLTLDLVAAAGAVTSTLLASQDYFNFPQSSWQGYMYYSTDNVGITLHGFYPNESLTVELASHGGSTGRDTNWTVGGVGPTLYDCNSATVPNTPISVNCNADGSGNLVATGAKTSVLWYLSNMRITRNVPEIAAPTFPVDDKSIFYGQGWAGSADPVKWAGPDLPAGWGFVDPYTGWHDIPSDAAMDTYLLPPEGFTGEQVLSPFTRIYATGEVVTWDVIFNSDVPTAPTTDNSSVDVVEDVAYEFLVSDFPFSDVNAGDVISSVIIKTLPASGLLKLDGVNVSVDDEIVVADITSGLLTFTTDSNENGTPYTTFTFAVSDGTFESSNTGVMTVNASPVNDAPIANGIPSKTATVGVPFYFQFSLSAFTDPDGDALTYSATLSTSDPLPVWLTFNATTREFSGTPAEIDIGTITVRVTAEDSEPLSAYNDFNITIIVSDEDQMPDITANTIPDIPVEASDWSDAYTLSGVSVGTRVFIQNKSTNYVLLSIAPTKPTASSMEGRWMKPQEVVIVGSGASGCWIKSISNGATIGVQEV